MGGPRASVCAAPGAVSGASSSAQRSAVRNSRSVDCSDSCVRARCGAHVSGRGSGGGSGARTTAATAATPAPAPAPASAPPASGASERSSSARRAASRAYSGVPSPRGRAPVVVTLATCAVAYARASTPRARDAGSPGSALPQWKAQARRFAASRVATASRASGSRLQALRFAPRTRAAIAALASIGRVAWYGSESGVVRQRERDVMCRDVMRIRTCEFLSVIKQLPGCLRAACPLPGARL